MALNVVNGLALRDQLISGWELVDDRLGCMGDSLHGETTGQIWPNQNFHSSDPTTGGHLGRSCGLPLTLEVK